jgi:hypothetical protein
MSLRKSTVPSSICSGAMNDGEPTRMWCEELTLRLIAAPKSVTFTSVSPARRMFAGLMSRCTSPSWLTYSSAFPHLKMTSTALSTSMRLPGWQYFSSVPPSTYSITT